MKENSFVNSVIQRKVSKVLIIVICFVLILATYYGLTHFIINKIHTKLSQLNGKASTIQVYLITGSIYLTNLELYSNKNLPYEFKLNTVKIDGINLFVLLTRKQISFESVLVTTGKFKYKISTSKNEKKNKNYAFKYFSINKLVIKDVLLEISTDTVINYSSTFECKVSSASVRVDSVSGTSFSAEAAQVIARGININRNSGMYGGTIKQFSFNSEDERIEIDSAILIPNRSKFEFAHSLGQQTDRINLLVPHMTVDGLKIKELLAGALVASKVQVNSFFIHAFKDKRLPSITKKIIPLPMESFLKLKHEITIDSILINNSKIVVEEISPEGKESGTITFEKVNAASSRLTNRSSKSELNTIVKTKGLLMGVGKIEATFLLPLGDQQTYFASGSISNLPLNKLRNPLENLALIHFESGYLNNLDFDFEYTNNHSRGSLILNYDNIQITSFQKKNGEKNIAKSLLINALVKTNKNKSLALEKRSGKIDFERNQEKFIFNYWWKSILSGIKSAVLQNEPLQKDKKV